MTNEQYYSLIQPYSDANQLLLTRLEMLNHKVYSQEAFHPIHTVQSRMKAKKSIERKLSKMNSNGSVQDAKDFLKDIAGIRVICYFVSDIQKLVNALKKQNDLIVIQEKDYISRPKPNGYRSYHVIVGIPVYYMDAMEYYPVEIQFRTISMDFWASMEHRICYKKKPEHEEELRGAFLQYAGILREIEESFEAFSEMPSRKEGESEEDKTENSKENTEENIKINKSENIGEGQK